MKLVVTRQIKSKNSTIGTLSVDGVFECFTLEPVDRGLISAMTLQQIRAIKIQGKTAIPTGTYSISRYYSPDHHTVVLIILNVIDFGYVEIHIGNFSKDTKACLLPGTEKGIDEVLNSEIAVEALNKKVFKALDNGEDVTITYQ